MIYGYARVSTRKQNINRQIHNILSENSSAKIYSETFTGTTTQRPEWNKLLRRVRPGDTIIFDEVSRMSRNAEEGFQTYRDLYEKGISLVFIKEPMINTEVYRQTAQIALTGTDADVILEGVNKYLMILAEKQIQLAFDTAQKEVDYLHQRTSEGIRNAQASGKIIGRRQGAKIETQKSREQKEVILKHSIDFGGSLSDSECIKMTGLSRNTFYKYKRELRG